MTTQRNFVELAKWLQTKPGTIASRADHAIAQLSNRYRPHLIDGSRSPLKDLDFKHYEKSFDGVSINYLQYGPEVKIDAGDFENFYMLEFPVSGGVDVQFNEDTVSSGPAAALLLSPGYPVRSTWKRNTQQVMIKLDKFHLGKFIEERFGRKSDGIESAIFEPHLSIESLNVRRISELLLILANEDAEGANSDHYDPTPLLGAICETLVKGVTLYEGPASSQPSGSRPGHLSRFLSLLNDPEMLSRPVSELALRAGTTDRTLRNSAHRFLSMSPHDLIVRKRLERARHMLSQGNLSIGYVAAMSGYSNAGRFAKAYKSQFGHLPSRIDALDR